jgi:fibronectin type 3 domain-containing protein
LSGFPLLILTTLSGMARHLAVTSCFHVPIVLGIAVSLLVGLAACDVFGGDTTPPDAPTGLVGTSQDGAVVLEWSAPGDSDVDGYNMYRAESHFSDTSSAQKLNGERLVGETAYRDDGAANGTTYHYRVTAVDEASNESDLSSSVEKTAFPDPPDEP